MLKTGKITENLNENNYKKEMISDSDKENKQENIQEINSNDIKSLFNKTKDKKTFFVNVNINKINLLANTNSEQNINNKNINFVNNIIQNNNCSKKIKNYFSEKHNFQNREIKFQTLNDKSENQNINLFTPITSKNINNISNKVFNSLVLENKIFKLKGNKKENIINQKNSTIYKIHNEKKEKFLFNTKFVVKKNSNKNSIKSLSLEKDLNIKNIEKRNYINKKDKNNIILLKYSRDFKKCNNNDETKNNFILSQKEKNEYKENKEEVINNIHKKENIAIEDDDKNIEIGDIRDIEDNKIQNKQTIFNKIIEEVKGEKNYIQKVVHRQIINQRENLGNSLKRNSFKKYDTNTYKEITTKRIKNPFNISMNKENKNNYSINGTNNMKNETLENNKCNYSSISIFNYNTNNNLNNELFKLKKDNIKKSSIKIKKIPLGRLRNKIKIQNLNYNIVPKLNNTPRMNISQSNYFYSNYSFNKGNNSYMTGYSPNSKKNKNINLNDIPKLNSSITNKNKPKIGLNINNDIIENNNEKYNKRIYNKVKLKKKIFSKINEHSIKINKVNSFYKTNNYSSNRTSIQSNSRSPKIIKINSGKINNNERNNQIILSAKNLTRINNINRIPDGNENKKRMIMEKKIGLFKKKYTGILEKQNNIEYKNLYFDNLYNKKNNNTIFNTYYISNKKEKMNDSYNFNSFIKLNSNNNDSISLISLDSNTIENLNLNKLGCYQNLVNESSNNIFNTNNTYLNNEIKLEQIITLLSLEDLLIIEDKLNIVLKILKNGKKSPEELFDLWNYFFSSSLKPKFEQIFKYFFKESEAMKLFINYSLILIIICYDFSFNSKNNNININFSLFETLRLVYINLLIVISSIKNKIKVDNKDHYNLRLIEMSNINKIIDNNLINFNNNTYNEDNLSFNRELLNNNTNLLIKNISLIIKNYKQTYITNLFYNIRKTTLDEINTFFRKNIIREDFLGCSVLASTFLKEKQNFIPEQVPYIRTKNYKKYSLVLDLDETLIHFNVNHEQNDEGVLKLRPGVFTFLEKVKEYYEIILFTEASEAYTELLMEAFNKKKYFDYKLFRQHTIIIGEDFVKDLQRIGRPLDKIIIIDNIAQNFRMQKPNGINIKPFYGENQKDKALIDLIPILINIAKDNIDTRNGLIKYRDEIITKITSNLFNRNDDKN